MADNPDFGTFGRFVETPVAEMAPDMKEAYHFTMKFARPGSRPTQDLAVQSYAIESDRPPPENTTRPSRH